jgi:hypothetical protein
MDSKDLEVGSRIGGRATFAVNNAAGNTVLPVSGSDNGNGTVALITGLKGFKATGTFTRPANTTLYTALDAITDSTTAPTTMSFDLSSFGATAGRFLVVTNGRVISSVKGTGLSVNIVIFPVTFTTTYDNYELEINDTVAATGGIVVPCSNNYTFLGNARCVSDPGWWEMQLTDTNIYFTLQAANGYTPASGEIFTVVLEGFFL